MKAHISNEGAETLDNVGTVVTLQDNIQVHQDPFILLLVTGTAHLLKPKPDTMMEVTQDNSSPESSLITDFPTAMTPRRVQDAIDRLQPAEHHLPSQQ